MSEELLSLLPLDVAGCNAKLGAEALLHLLDQSSLSELSFLAPDCREIGSEHGRYATIDTIVPMTRNPRHFGRIALFHAFNDLYAKGVTPADICISLAFTKSQIDSGLARTIVDEITKTVSEMRVHIAKGHTYLTNDVSITISAIGTRASSILHVRNDHQYNIVLSKPLGSSLAYHLGTVLVNQCLASISENNMLLNHGALINQLQACYAGTTDISGFGLLGHLASAVAQEKWALNLFLSQIPIVDGLLDIPQLGSLSNCAARRNENDFEKHCTWESHLP